MMYLLDTCVISETRAKRPDAAVIEWISRQMPENLYLSVLSMGEIRNGICMLGNTRKAQALSEWLNELKATFGSHVLPVDAAIAECWGETLANCAQSGMTRPAIDALIAATAKVYDLILVTRNVRDMEGTGCKILNPFSA